MIQRSLATLRGVYYHLGHPECRRYRIGPRVLNESLYELRIYLAHSRPIYIDGVRLNIAMHAIIYVGEYRAHEH